MGLVPQESSGVRYGECALYSPRTILVEKILLWVVTAPRSWTGIYFAGIVGTKASRSPRLCSSTFVEVWGATVVQRRYTKAFEAHRERGRKLTSWYCKSQTPV